MPSPLKPCRGGCGTDLLDPDAPIQLFGICVDCLAAIETIGAQQAWQKAKELRIAKGLDTVNLSELVDEEIGYRNVVVGGAETIGEQVARYEEPT